MRRNTVKLTRGYCLRIEPFGALLFDQHSGQVRQLNRTAGIALSALLQGHDAVSAIHCAYPGQPLAVIRDDIETLVGKLASYGALSESHMGRFIPLDWETHGQCLVAPRSVFWEITNRCNIGTCLHCYSNGNKPIADTTGVDLLQEIARIGVFTLDIGGGEPLLRNDLVDIVNTANELGLRCNIASNLSLGTGCLRHFLAGVSRWDINNLQGSLDGHNGHAHDIMRGKQGCFEQLRTNVKVLKSAGMRVELSCTVTRLNLQYIDRVATTAWSMGADAMRFVRAIPSGRAVGAEWLLGPEEYRAMCAQLRHLRESWHSKIKVTIDDSFGFLEASPEERLRRRPRLTWLRPPSIGCGAGRTLLTIDATGQVFPCAYMRDERHVAGVLGQDDIRTVWRTSQVLWRLRDQVSLGPVCDGCDCRDLCQGGCRAAALGQTGILESRDPGCWKANDASNSQ